MSFCCSGEPALFAAYERNNCYNIAIYTLITGAHLFLQFGKLVLGVDQVQDDIECASENKGKEEAEPSQVGISLRAEN